MNTLHLAQDTLTGSGFYSVVLPFMLTFAVMYGLLVKLDLFGHKTNQVSTVIALVMAFYVGQSVAAAGIATGLIGMFSSVAVVLVVALMALTGAALVGITPASGKADRVFQAMAGLVGLGIVGLAVHWGILEFIVPGGLPTVGVALTGAEIVTAAVVLMAAAGVAYPVLADGHAATE